MVIYKTTNTLNGKTYIGQDSNNNPNYYGSGLKIKRAIKKYGKENFKKEILEECDNITQLNSREIYWIAKLNTTDRKTGYNISIGGAEGDREKGRKILIEKGRYQYWLEKYGAKEADIRHSNWKSKISKYQQEKMENGWSHTDESKKKIGESTKNRVVSEESKIKMRKAKPKGFGEKISKLKKGVKLGPSPKRIKVLQLKIDGTLLKEWNSISEVEKELKIYNISAVCKNKQNSAGGFKWKYKNNIYE